MPSPRSPVGVVGLGLLGSAIAERLRARGYPLVGHDLDRERARRSSDTVAGSLAAVADAAERVVLSLPHHEVVEEVVSGPAGLLSGERRPRLVVDTTTGDPESTRRLAERLETLGVHFVDAAVSGSSNDLRRGEAVLLAGGSREALEAARDILDTLAPAVFHLGEAGSGAVAKLVTNLALGLNRLVLAEAMALAERVGLSTAALLELLRAGPAYSRVVDTKGRKMLHGDFRPQARLAQHQKDVQLILEMARQAGAAVPLSEAHAEVLARGVAGGHGEEDNSAVIQVLREMAERSGEEKPPGAP